MCRFEGPIGQEGKSLKSRYNEITYKSDLSILCFHIADYKSIYRKAEFIATHYIEGGSKIMRKYFLFAMIH